MVAEVTATVGVLLIVTVAVFEELQLPEVPVTVYTVLDDGLTTMLEPVAPVFHE